MSDVLVVKEAQIQVIEEEKGITILQKELVNQVIIEVPDHFHPTLIPIRETEEVIEPIPMGTPHSLPNGESYIKDTMNKGRYLSVLLNGATLTPHSTDETPDRDYEETNATQLTFAFDLGKGDHLDYRIYK